MTERPQWRALTDGERALIRAIVGTTKNYDEVALVSELTGALISGGSTWVFDVRAPNFAAVFHCPDGPFPARAFVPNKVDYRGEVVIWISGGHLSGLEYVWVTDQPPNRWPLPEELEVHPA
ncbi:MAG: hypothetical protein PGN37_11335 [Mycobacterium kyogaense]|uniref:hypothetical protein n=1 Tax=Mycobacterium kyogaense TaxID=2212479 RepID=UPI002FF698ED